MTEDTIPPIRFHWNGEAMIPHHPKRADQHYIVGLDYHLVPHEERSARSHNHYFASMTEAFDNLPENLAIQFPTMDHLRKYCLIKAGFFDSRSIVVASRAEAVRVAAFVQAGDDFAVVVANAATITVYTAKSQSLRAMSKTEFQRSKDRTLDIAAFMVHVTREELDRSRPA